MCTGTRTRSAFPGGLGSAGTRPPPAGSSCSRARPLHGEGLAQAAGGVHGLPDGRCAGGMRGLRAPGVGLSTGQGAACAGGRQTPGAVPGT